ncbi:MAG: hypothetical protein MJ136_07045, partial [Clostridia bacterium]|nr:hypothetical protein [Clostridia bacterium]
FCHGPRGIEANTEELKAMLDRWFEAYVDPRIDGAREPVCGRGQLTPLGEKAQGKLTFSPVSQVEYKR